MSEVKNQPCTTHQWRVFEVIDLKKREFFEFKSVSIIACKAASEHQRLQTMVAF